MVWLKSVDGVFFWCNPVLERLFGAKEKDIIGRTDYDFLDKELADLLCNAGEYDDAIGHYNEALRFRPNFVEAKDNLAFAHSLAGH